MYAINSFRHAYFNPRSSCEERHEVFGNPDNYVLFQSTLLMRGATWLFRLLQKHSVFQSTLLMRGATKYHPGECADK